MPNDVEPRAGRKLVAAHLLIALAAVGLRVVIVSQACWFPRSDTRDYHEYAVNLLRGNGYVNRFNEHPAYRGFVKRAFRPPGYPLLLAGIYRLGGFEKVADIADREGHGLVRYAYLANVLADALTMLLVVLLAYRLVGPDRRAGPGAGRASPAPAVALLAQGVHALNVTWTPNLMTESVFTTLMVAGIYLLARPPRHDHLGANLLLGIVIMAAVMVRPIGVVLLIASFLVHAPQLRWRTLWRYGPVVLPLAAYLAVWLGRNYALYGHLLLGSNLGHHLSLSFRIDRVREFVALKAQLGRLPNEYEYNAHLVRRILDRAWSEPCLAWQVYWMHLVNLFSLRPVWELKGWLWVVTFHHTPVVADLHRLLYAHYQLLYPAALLGALVHGRRGGRLLVPFVVFLLVHPLVSKGHVRFLAPFTPLMAVFAAAFLVWLVGELGRRVHRWAAGARRP